MNVLNKPLEICTCNSKKTGWNRDGYCSNHPSDPGTHIVCAIMTKDFLRFTKSKGNDLITPTKNFPGLVPGDCWCLCVGRWIQAYEKGVAPPLLLRKTDKSVLKYVDIDILKRYALD